MEYIIHSLQQKEIPAEIINNIIYKQNGVIHPNALLIKKKRIECSKYCYIDSGGWEVFNTFTSIYDNLSKTHNIKPITLQFYIYGLDNW